LFKAHYNRKEKKKNRSKKKTEETESTFKDKKHLPTMADGIW
jgi:hypothetical protein